MEIYIIQLTCASGKTAPKRFLRQVQCDSVALMIESVMCCTDCKSPGVKSVFLGCMNKTELTCVCVCVSVRMCVCETPIWILGHATPLHSASLPHSSLPFSLSLSLAVLIPVHQLLPSAERGCIGVCVCRWHSRLSWRSHSCHT